VSLYLDTSVVVALLTEDPLNQRASAFLRDSSDTLIISDFGSVEFSAVVARRAALAIFDAWTARTARRVGISGADVADADTHLRRLDLTLLTPDAIHIAIAGRIGATLVTFDRAMAVSARAVGMAVTTPYGVAVSRKSARSLGRAGGSRRRRGERRI
jgi:predicted nucleic acid-binding protein